MGNGERGAVELVVKAAGAHVRFQTKVYNADCQPDPPFSALLPVALRKDIAEWQITGQTVGLQYLPASVVDQTARQFRRVAELVPSEGGVMLYAGAYRRADGILLREFRVAPRVASAVHQSLLSPRRQGRARTDFGKCHSYPCREKCSNG